MVMRWHLLRMGCTWPQSNDAHKEITHHLQVRPQNDVWKMKRNTVRYYWTVYKNIQQMKEKLINIFIWWNIQQMCHFIFLKPNMRFAYIRYWLLKYKHIREVLTTDNISKIPYYLICIKKYIFFTDGSLKTFHQRYNYNSLETFLNKISFLHFLSTPYGFSS